MEMTQEEKAVRLQQAVINSSVEEISKVYDELGYVEMPAPALGLACRFRGLAVVKALAEKGVTFDFPLTEEIETRYRCYIGQKYANYRTNYSLYLLKIFRGGLKGACSTKGMKFTQNAKRDAGKPLPFLADDERVRVLDYLIQQKEQLSFQPEEMLFYAIYAKDAVIYEALKKRGVTLSERRVQSITEGGAATDGYWFEYGSMTGKLADEDYLEIMQLLASELGGKPFYYTEKMFAITKNRFRDIRVFDYFLAHFRQDKMNKYQMIRGLIDDNVLEAMSVVEREGWLRAPKKRDEMIEYASQNKKTEALAWLLDYKNRTADFAAEQEKEEKKLMRELNAAPDSVYELKKIWSYKKREDGTLMITKYKGTDVEVTVPEKIGKGVVTAIGEGAFSAESVFITWEQRKQRCAITKITLPQTIEYIGESAFFKTSSLREINIPESVRKIKKGAFEKCSAMECITIPEGVQEIGADAFGACSSLKSITIPGTVKIIERRSFIDCNNLEKVHICEGVLEIRERAFENCSSLEAVRIPKSVQHLLTAHMTNGMDFEVFRGCPKLIIYCPEGSRAEDYCREKGFRFKYDNNFCGGTT